MVTNFIKYNESIEWKDNYLVCVPSGEVIYFSDDDIEPLVKRNLIFYPTISINLYRWGCSDFLSQKVKDYLETKKKIKSILPKIGEDRHILTKNLIIEFLLDCGLLKDQFSILPDLSVDAMGPVNMAYKKLTRIPVKFNRCSSDFNCSYNLLETLENSPRTVHGRFDCSFNHLEDLNGGPRLVSKLYNCSHNKLTSLTGSPIKLIDFNCSNNLLKNINDAPVVKYNFIKNNNSFNDKEI